MGPLQGSRVKIRGHMIAHRTPSAPRLQWVPSCVIARCDNQASICTVKVSLGHSTKATVARIKHRTKPKLVYSPNFTDAEAMKNVQMQYTMQRYPKDKCK